MVSTKVTVIRNNLKALLLSLTPTFSLDFSLLQAGSLKDCLILFTSLVLGATLIGVAL